MNQQSALAVAYNPGNYSYADWLSAHEKLKSEKPDDAAILTRNILAWRAAQTWVVPVVAKPKKRATRKKVAAE